MRWWEVAGASIVRAVRVAVVVVSTSASASAFALSSPPGCLHACCRTSCRHGGVGEGTRATRNGLLRAPQTTVIAKGRKGGGGEDDLEPRFGRRPRRPPLSSAATIGTLVTPPSSSVIAVTIFLSFGCDATMCSLMGEEGGAPASAPVSPVNRTSLPLPLLSWRRHQVIVAVTMGGWKIPPPPLAADQRTPRRQQRRWRCHHGGEEGEPKNCG